MERKNVLNNAKTIKYLILISNIMENVMKLAQKAHTHPMINRFVIVWKILPVKIVPY